MDMPSLDQAVRVVRDHIPGFGIRYKDESWSSKVIAVLVWIFNRRYLTAYTTTRYPRVYFPSRAWVKKNPRVATKVLLHEFVHLWDRKQERIWHVFGYGFPQILFLFFLPVFIVALCIPGPALKWWVTGIAGGLALLSLVPWPAWFRRRAELRGYTMNMAINVWRYGSVVPGTVLWISKHFTGWEYYRMCWRKGPIRKSILRIADVLVENRLTDAEVEGDTTPFLIVRQLLFPVSE